MRKLLVTIVLVLSVFYTGLLACTDIGVGKLATVDGSVISAQSVDGSYDSRLLIQPAADHEPGSMTPVWEWIVYADRRPLVQLGEIPQVEHTYSWIQTSYPFSNEKGLLMGETTQGGARETANSPDAIMTIEQLQAFALQRCTTAREAIELMGSLAVEYGYRESCSRGEGLTIADGEEVWWFEIYGVGPLWKPGDGPGAIWAAQRVPDDHIMVNGNASIIGEIDLETNLPPGVSADDFMICDNYLQSTIELGLWTEGQEGPFVWKKVIGTIRNWNPRLWRVFSKFQPSGNWEYGGDTSEYPFSFRPDRLVSVYDIIELYRDVMTDTPGDQLANEAWLYKDRDGNDVLSNLATPQPGTEIRNLLGLPSSQRFIGVQSTSCYFINQTRSWLPPEIGAVSWFGLGNGHKATVVPIYAGITRVPESWATVNRGIAKIDRDAAFWAFYTVDRLSNQRYGDMMPRIDAVRIPLQQKMYDMQPAIEETALKLYEADRDMAVEFLTTYTNSLMVEVEQAYWDLADSLILRLP